MSSGAKSGNRATGQVKDGPGTGCLLTTGWALAKDGGHPQVRGACVKDNLEFLRGCSNGDVTHVELLQGKEGSGLVQNWLPSIPTLLPPIGCHISLEITF